MFVAFAGAPAVAVARSTAEDSSQNSIEEDFDLVLRPTRVFKTPDRTHEATESWIFSLVVQTTKPGALSPASMTIELLKGQTMLKRIEYPTAGFAPLTYVTSSSPTLSDGSAAATPIYWHFVIRLRQTEPMAFGTDAMKIAIEASDAQGRRGSKSIAVPIETYIQKNSLIFPFRGKGIVLQAGATNGGHRNRSGGFAIDASGLDSAWSICSPGEGTRHSDYRGWGRDLVAPADGIVVRARNDRPDQPVADESDPKYWTSDFQKQGGGDPGNHLVIDHGSDEFSMIAHFMAGSMVVKKGDRVKQGELLGKLGQSGDTNGPHCHYQLQSGPDWVYADGLPCKFTNVSEQFLDRGTYFTAK